LIRHDSFPRVILKTTEQLFQKLGGGYNRVERPLSWTRLCKSTTTIPTIENERFKSALQENIQAFNPDRYNGATAQLR